jgi:hypothetical protein
VAPIDVAIRTLLTLMVTELVTAATAVSVTMMSTASAEALIAAPPVVVNPVIPVHVVLSKTVPA